MRQVNGSAESRILSHLLTVKKADFQARGPKQAISPALENQPFGCLTLSGWRS
jgi:hypothetical protein